MLHGHTHAYTCTRAHTSNQVEDIGQCLLSCLLSDWGLLAELSSLKNLFLMASPAAQAWADRTLSGMLFHGRPLEEHHEYELDVALQVGKVGRSGVDLRASQERGGWLVWTVACMFAFVTLLGESVRTCALLKERRKHVSCPLLNTLSSCSGYSHHTPVFHNLFIHHKPSIALPLAVAYLS